MQQIDRRIPVISDPGELVIPWRTLQTIIAGRSLIDTRELHIENLDEAGKFLEAYGIGNREDAANLLRNALEYVQTVLLEGTNLRLPAEVWCLGLPELLVEASGGTRSALSEWSCLILKVCHAVAHASWTRDEDAYEAALDRLRARLEPFIIASRDGIWIGDENCRIPVLEYSFKTEKKFFRVVTKLLLKAGNLSTGIYDHIGVRFVTNDIFAAILLIRFLRSRHIFMYANLLPQESRNSIAGFRQMEQLFAEYCSPMPHGATGHPVHEKTAKANPYSNRNFKMVKIVERVMVETKSGRRTFFPCEYQILTRKTHAALGKHKTSHSAYEKRQVQGVRNRLMHRNRFVRET